jgi:putative Mg2+ transporter-C (MgtC) family protein
MNIDGIPNELFTLPELTDLIRVTVRFCVAALLGGILGYEREREGKAAGLRTHMLVALGAALFVIGPLESGMHIADISRIFQGIATGIGFLGAGTILKLADDQRIEGLTTAAGIWLTAAIGIAAGLGLLWIPIISTVLALLIFTALTYVERQMKSSTKQ